MLLLIFLILVITTPLASVNLSSIFHRIAFLIFLLSGLLSYNILYITPLLTGAPRRFEGYFKLHCYLKSL